MPDVLVKSNCLHTPIHARDQLRYLDHWNDW